MEPGGELSHSDAERLAINAAWLAKLRWVAVAGQLATILIAAGPLGVKLPFWPLLGMAALTAGTNAVFWAWTRRRRLAMHVVRPYEWHALLGGLMVLDLFVLTVMLELTGGPTNPFVIFYFVNLALGGILLPARWAWLLVLMATAAFATISYTYFPIAQLRHASRLMSFRELGGIPVVGGGTLIAFATCGSVIVSFTTWLTRELRRNQEARFRAEELRARSEKLEALGTLAAGAAHELATPLSTIAVVAKELEHELDASSVSPEVAADVKLIRNQLDRCRAILDRMSTASGQAAGEAPETFTAGELLLEVINELPDPVLIDTTYAGEAADARLTAPRTALSQALRALVQNALDARPGGEVEIEVYAHGTLGIAIRDTGPGMPREVLARAGEPFFTTKEPGKGMGLGLFLARSVVERVGGGMEIDSEAGHGTVVEVKLPLAG
ncbi:Sensor histidine kinase RegB [Posidoniimonas polymericola]|uniref:histidine kinase n=1 Tax=Posidoniimonas polymericola TaxID=2528002 RepID=A0A5C5ZD14_9BACT|nr:ATP-binding protein [Posidoniimonas polymericola]TWT85224.1 Sensor histidine kinase RegB [Posidoniimonas polymericola]